MSSGVTCVASSSGCELSCQTQPLAEDAVGTRFNLGSINKAFTQVAVRQLVREGKMALNDTLGKFFPDYPQAASRVATIEQLLTHRGGLSDFFGQDFTGAAKDRFRSNPDYFRFIGTLLPRFATGTRSESCRRSGVSRKPIATQPTGSKS